MQGREIRMKTNGAITIGTSSIIEDKQHIKNSLINEKSVKQSHMQIKCIGRCVSLARDCENVQQQK